MFGASWKMKLISLLGVALAYAILNQALSYMLSSPPMRFLATAVVSLTGYGHAAAEIDLKWYAPNATATNNLSQAIGGGGVYGFIYNSSVTPNKDYGIYNWCNMPHVRAEEYQKPSSEYKLQYVEVVSLNPRSMVRYQYSSFP